MRITWTVPLLFLFVVGQATVVHADDAFAPFIGGYAYKSEALTVNADRTATIVEWNRDPALRTSETAVFEQVVADGPDLIASGVITGEDCGYCVGVDIGRPVYLLIGPATGVLFWSGPGMTGWLGDCTPAAYATCAVERPGG